ncbi:unnamed protein product [Cercospora beticola]|nr:unnamed protein product [Cercospora beticola]
MTWMRALLLLFLARGGNTASRGEDRKDDENSSSFSDDESAYNNTSPNEGNENSDGEALAKTCPITRADWPYGDHDFLPPSASGCGPVACRTFTPLTNLVMTWTKIDTIHPVTVGAEVVIIDRERNLTSTSTEIITTAIVVDMGGRETTLDPSLWNNNGTFDISNVPTKTTTQIDHWGTVHTIK